VEDPELFEAWLVVFRAFDSETDVEVVKLACTHFIDQAVSEGLALKEFPEQIIF